MLYLVQIAYIRTFYRARTIILFNMKGRSVHKRDQKMTKEKYTEEHYDTRLCLTRLVYH